MTARALTRLAGIALVVWSIYLFTRPVVAGPLQCGSVIEPKHVGQQGIAGIFAEAACANVRNSAQTSAVVVAVAGVLLILIAVYFWPARDRTRNASSGTIAPTSPERVTGSLAPPPAPGWYDDPHDPTRIRYWDGASWAPRTAPKPVQP